MVSNCRFWTRLAAVLFALVMMASVASAQAQTPASQTEFLGASFAQSFQGREVWLTTSSGQRLKARIGTVVAAGLNLTSADGKSQTVKFADIARVEKVTHRLRNHLIAGATIGSLLGMLGTLGCDDASCAGGFVAIYGAIGTGIGALNGAIRNSLNRDDDLIYQAGPRTTTLALAPIVSRDRKGVSFSLSWR